MNRKAGSRGGFTIIEVVLVLAIAGLIFAAVFIALPALQRSQRNTQRRNDLAMIKSAMENWKTHNRHTSSIKDSYPNRNHNDGFCTFYKRYVGEEMKDPLTGEAYNVALYRTTYVANCLTGAIINRGGYDPDVHGSNTGEAETWAKMDVGDIQYNDTGICTDDGAFTDDVSSVMGSRRDKETKMFAIRIRLEGGSAACVDGVF